MSTEQEASYQVGYKKPPLQHRFTQGRSGNPNGRAKKAETIHTFLDQALKEKVVVNENGRRKTISKFEAFVKQLVNRATGGDARAGKLLIELLREAKPDLTAPIVIHLLPGDERP